MYAHSTPFQCKLPRAEIFVYFVHHYLQPQYRTVSGREVLSKFFIILNYTILKTELYLSPIFVPPSKISHFCSTVVLISQTSKHGVILNFILLHGLL